MKLWKQSMQTYTGYLRKDVDITPDLYYDIFMNLCDPDMRKKLDSVKGIREMGETKIWEIIEGILVETNPIYIRRVKAYDLRMEKGESAGDFFNRLRNEYAEAEMEKATPWTMFVCKLISSLPATGNEARVKEQLLETFRENPDPEENELAKFQTVIKEHESLMTAREFKGAVGRTVGIVTDDPPKPPGKAGQVCGE